MMKSSEETLRTAVAHYRRYHNKAEFLRQDGTIGDKIRCACTVCRMVDTVSEETDLERLRDALMQPVYKVTDEHGDSWWTMPEEVFGNIFAEFGVGEEG